MATGKEIFETLLFHFKRLHSQFLTWEAKMSESLKGQIFRSFITDSIFAAVPTPVAGEAVKMATTHEGLLKALELPEIQSKALEIIILMEDSENWEQFQEKDKKPPEKPPKELTDFDKLLKGFLKVLPPKKDKKPKEGE